MSSDATTRSSAPQLVDGWWMCHDGTRWLAWDGEQWKAVPEQTRGTDDTRFRSENPAPSRPSGHVNSAAKRPRRRRKISEIGQLPPWLITVLSVGAAVLFYIMLWLYEADHVSKKDQGNVGVAQAIFQAALVIAVIGVMQFGALYKAPKTSLVSYIAVAVVILGYTPAPLSGKIMLIIVFAPIGVLAIFLLPWILLAMFAHLRSSTPIHLLDRDSREYLQRTGQALTDSSGNKRYKGY